VQETTSFTPMYFKIWTKHKDLRKTGVEKETNKKVFIFFKQRCL